MKQKKGPEQIGLILESMLAERGLSTICKEYDVVARWAEIVGPQLAGVTTEVRLDESVLYVKISSSPWRQELSYLKRQILEKIREVTGCATIRDIVFC